MKGFKLSHSDKPSRRAAFDIALLIASGREVSQHEKDALVNYFSPSAPAKPATLEQWVARSAGVKDSRPYLKFVHVGGGVMYGSDGCTIRWAKTDRSDGWYNPKSLLETETDCGSYPDVKGRFITSATRPVDALEVPEEQSVFITKTAEITYKVVHGVPVDVNYLNPALQAPGVTEWRAFHNEALNALRVDAADGSCGFIISGLRL